MHSENSFTISFEEDLFTEIQNHGFRTRSLFKSSRSPTPDKLSTHPKVDHDQEIPQHLVSESEIADSYFSATLSTIQPLGDHKSLLLLTIVCHPAPGRRFVNATVTWRVASPLSSGEATPDIPSSSPKIVTLAPQHCVGGWTEEQTKLIWGLSVPAQVGFGGASIGVEPAVERETGKAVMHAMTIIGTVRSGGTRATWTIEENKSSQRGIPSHLRLAIVVDHDTPFLSEFDVKAELGGGLWPTFIQAKKGKSGNGLKRVIDVEKWKTGEIEWEPSEQGWKTFVAEMTGEVPGVMLEFHQAIVRP